MNILSELNQALSDMGFDVETGVFSGEAPDEYIVLTSMSDTFPLFADNMPVVEAQEVRISLFSKKNYINRKKQMVKNLLDLGFTITGQNHLGREDDTGFFHAAVDVVKSYEF